MTVGANSYGSAAEVAPYVMMWTNAGSFDTTTQPTLAQVEGFIDQVSAIVNTALAAQGFSIPVTQPDAVLAIKNLVMQVTADLVQASNSAGRFFTDRAIANGVNMWRAIRNEIYQWVEEYAPGFEQLGASRTAAKKDTIGYRDTDERGNNTFPIFQRDAFGNTFQDWDSDQ